MPPEAAFFYPLGEFFGLASLQVDSPPAIREDLVAALERAWQRIADPGTWWSGTQRIAIAAETRNAPQCGLCQQRKSSLSPFAITGEHDVAGKLPGAVVEVVHRVRTDSGRLTRSWYEDVLASGLSDAQYVEMSGAPIDSKSARPQTK